MTFQSQRIARHLVRLLFVAESYDEARRALDSYVQIVEKSRAAGQGSHAQEQNGADVGIKDVDDDRTYVQTLIMGAHYVGRYCKDYTAANTIAQKALDLVQQRKVTEQSLVALVMRVNGATRAALAIQRECNKSRNVVIEQNDNRFFFFPSFLRSSRPKQEALFAS